MVCFHLRRSNADDHSLEPTTLLLIRIPLFIAKRLLANLLPMYPHVLLEIVISSEAFPTNFARMRSLAGMHRLTVSPRMFLANEASRAFAAAIGPENSFCPLSRGFLL